MAEYTSTLQGFQRLMEWHLTGLPEETEACVAATVLPNFWHIMNGEKFSYDTYVNAIKEWRGKISDYKPTVHEFLRDGDQLAGRMTGTIQVEGVPNFFESFMFAKVDKETGKLEWLIERSIWGKVGGKPEHGAN
ncbi:mitochondrial substrate carrier protein [Rhypophila decipiens]|uniref:Mitochondrial substrate carrier protein n=1 Tax=Rhypophila decipiens TaxID=261697 RepID=A0AAN6XVS7_9PEZI|nr:mitochondrial substrate carrier protein [Rhypophila decipiens]